MSPDFSGIDPLRVPEARRRVAALNEYLKLDDPTAADTTRIAAGLGLSRNQFSRLARVWRDHRDARLLVIGKRGAATRDYGIDDRAIAITHQAIAEAGSAAKLSKVAPVVMLRCAEAGVVPPSRQTIYNYIRKTRADTQAPLDGPPRVVIGRMWFHLPISGLPASTMPMVFAAILLPERIIVAHAVSLDTQRPPSVDALIDALAVRATPGPTPRPVLLDPGDRRVGAAAFERAGLGRTRSHNRSVQREISKSLAGRLGPLAAIYQRSMARPTTKKVITRQDEALPPTEVSALIEDAIEAHNAAMSMARPAFDIAPLTYW